MRIKLLKNKEKINKSNTNAKKKTREKSTGRSMVEMLGVLAIIGVLSIGGISGYTIAMRRYRANEILNIANKFAAIVWTQAQQEIMNNPIYSDCMDTNISSVCWCDKCSQQFEKSELGSIPSGASNIHSEGIWSGNSGIGVEIIIVFENQSLCETAKSMTDVFEDAMYNCKKSSWEEDDEKKLSLYFYQK